MGDVLPSELGLQLLQKGEFSNVVRADADVARPHVRSAGGPQITGELLAFFPSYAGVKS